MSRRPTMKDFKLATVAEASDLEVDGGKAHDAWYEVGLTRELFRLLREIMQESAPAR